MKWGHVKSGHRLNLLVAYYFNEEPHLYKMDIYRGVYTRVASFEAIGGGESLGYYLLKENAKADPDFSQEMPIAISVVEKVIDNIDGCGRPTWVANVYPVPRIMIEHDNVRRYDYQCFTGPLPQNDMELISQELKKSEPQWAAMQKKYIFDVMQRTTKKFKRLFDKQREADKRRNKPA